jgi:hypothetical protein
LNKKDSSRIEECPKDTCGLYFGSIAKDSEKPEVISTCCTKHSTFTTEQHIVLIEDLALATGRAVDLINLTAYEPLLGEILKKHKTAPKFMQN